MMAWSVLTILIGAAIIPSLILAFPTDLDNREKRGSTAFRLYTCPLGDKRCDKRGIRWPYAPYWFKHTFIEIEGMCYDWGNWNYPNMIIVQTPALEDDYTVLITSLAKNERKRRASGYCYRKRKYTGYSSCTSRVGEFEDAWDDEGSSYNLLTWNCQRYSDAMKDFLNRCYSDASRAIP